MSWQMGVVGCAFVLAVCVPARAQTESAPNEPTTTETPDATTPAPVPAPVPTTPADRPFKRILPNFWQDIKRLPSIGTAVTLGIGGAMSAVAYKNDGYFTAHAAAGGTDQIFQAGGGLGAGFTQVGIAVGTYAVGRMTSYAPAAHIGGDLIRGQLLTGVITHSIKAISRRHRPTGEQESDTDTYSFPSAHASATWTTSTVLWRHLGWKVGVPASLLSAYVSASRLQQNAHYMSDVIFGAAIGVAAAHTVTIGHGERRLAVAPVAVPGGAAVALTLVPR